MKPTKTAQKLVFYKKIGLSLYEFSLYTTKITLAGEISATQTAHKCLRHTKHYSARKSTNNGTYQRKNTDTARIFRTVSVFFQSSSLCERLFISRSISLLASRLAISSRLS